MIRHILVIDFRNVLRTMLIAGVLAVLLVLACAGVTWVVDDDGDADFVNMQTAEAAA